MQPLRLTLRGFKGIRDGLRLDEFTLDLSADQGLVAIKGENGRGKTTLVDNLQPYRLLPSRVDGTFSPKACTMYDALDAPEASKELLWRYGDRKFRSLIAWRQSGKTRSCTAYLYELSADGLERPYTMLDGVTCDGKTDTYDRAVEEVLGSADVFFSSAFSAQGKKPISAMVPGDAKRWLGNLLNQAPIRALGDAARQVVRELTRALPPLRASAGQLTGHRALLNQRLEEEQRARARVDPLRGERAGAENELVNARAAQQAALAPDEVARAVRAQRETLTTARDAAATRLAAASATVAQLVAAEARRQAAELAARNSNERECKATQVTLRAPIERIEAIISQREAIERSLAERAVVIERIEQRERESLPAARRALEARTEKSTRLAGVETELSDLRGSYQQLRGIEVRAVLSSAVPCAGHEWNSECKLLSDARKARAEVPDFEQRMVSCRQRGDSLNAEKTALAKALAELQDPAAALRALEALQGEDRRLVQRTEAVVAQAAALRTADQDLVVARATLAEWEANRAAQREREDAREAQARVSAEEVIATAKATETGEHNERQRCDEAIAALPPSPDLANAAIAQRVTLAQQALDKVTASEKQLQTSISELAAQRAALEAQIAVAAAAERKLEEIETAIATWSLLGEALGDKGIIALEIDAAAPSIAAEANRLLASCYDGRFAVELKTQVNTANGDAKEGFDILVHDAQTNDTRSMSLLSGGQRVWVNEAVVRSVAVYLAQAGQRRYETLFTDEVDGALDPERKQAFMAMKRALLRMGYFSLEIFITQTPELLAHADRVVDLDAVAANAPAHETV